MTPQNEALRLIEEALKELESSKGSVLSAVQKLLRASGLAGNQDVQVWCAIQLGEQKYTLPLQELLTALTSKTDQKSKPTLPIAEKAIKDLEVLNLKQQTHFSNEELIVKASESGGGYINIGIVEERYADLIRTKRGNDGKYYKNNLSNHINYVRKKAHDLSSSLFNQLKFAGTISNCFELLKQAVDDRLLDLSPSLAEQLMLTFKRVSTNKAEEWSQALVTCRRLLEGLADELQPATNKPSKGRSLDQAQYVNRLWAFMDSSIESESNKELAKSHVDFLGSWMEKTNKIANKGVHAEVSQLESVKAIFHTYLVLADILEYMDKSHSSKKKPDINTATMDELEALLDVGRDTAKEIIKARVQQGHLDRGGLSKVRGVGPKTLEKAISVFSI